MNLIYTSHLLISNQTLIRVVFQLALLDHWIIRQSNYSVNMHAKCSLSLCPIVHVYYQVVLTVVVAFILEAFMFKIEYRHQTHENSSIDYLIQTQSLSLQEIHMINNVNKLSWSGDLIRNELSVPAVSLLVYALQLSCLGCIYFLFVFNLCSHYTSLFKIFFYIYLAREFINL